MRNQRLGLGMATAFGARGLSLGLTLLTVPLTLGYLGPERYGMWLTISSVIALLAFSDLGLGYGLRNAVTKSLARSDVGEARRQISSALALLIVVGIGLALIFVIVYPFIPWAPVLAVTSPTARAEAGPAFAALLAIFLVGLPLSVATQVRMARQESHIVSLTGAAGSVVSVVALLVVIQTQQGVPALVVAMAAPPVIATAVSAALLFGREVPMLRPSRSAVEIAIGRVLLRSGSLFFVIQVAMTVAFTTDTLVLAQMLGPDAVTEYGVTARLFLIPAGIIAIVLSPLWPAYGEAIARGDAAWARTALARSLKGGLIITVPAAGLLVAFGGLIIGIWVGGVVTPSMVLLLGLGVWMLQGTAGNAVAMFLNGAHEIRFQAASAALMAVVNIGLSIWLTSRIGVAGVVWGTVIAYGAFVLVPMALYVPGVLRRIGDSRVDGGTATSGAADRPA